ncbi:unnamed protein product [Blepharisma stoltei]|uniref:Uncharacterized protein n=1 Tax=Blepharisma stoltei TaxID=1481888 RepID=A0AAU9KAH9_9CILI|nr:unnamed protein product [Blepharisma stoltei]
MSFSDERKFHMSSTGSALNPQNPIEDPSSKARTPSPGRDYTQLLNESPTNKFYPELSSEEEDYAGKYSHIATDKDAEVKHTLKSLENEVQQMGKELAKLRTERNYLHTQLEIVKKEKEMHIEKHAKEKVAWEKDFRELQDRVSYERKQFREETLNITKQLQEMQENYKELKIKKEQQAEAFKRKLEENEQIYIQSLREKDSQLLAAKMKWDEGAKIQSPLASPKPENRHRHVCSRESKKKSLKRSLRLPSPKPPRESQKNNYLDDISHMIVTLEKEQAELKQKIKELEFNAAYERDKKKISDLIRRNEERLTEAKAIQEEMVKDSFISGGLSYR